MKRPISALGLTLLLAIGAAPPGARAASTWDTAGVQKLAPGPAEGEHQFAATGTDGFDIAGYQHFTTGSSSDQQALTITQRGSAFPDATLVSPAAFYLKDMKFSANTAGDLAYAFSYANPDDENETIYGVGTRPAGGVAGPALIFDHQETGTQGTHVVAVDVGVNKDVVVVYQGVGLKVFATVGKIGGTFSKPVELTQPGHYGSDQDVVGAAIDQNGEAFAVWRDAIGTYPYTGNSPPGRIAYAEGKNGTFTPPRFITPASEDANTPLSVARNDAGDMIFAWDSGAAYRRRGGAVGPEERHGLYNPDQAALDPDGVAFLAGRDQGDKTAVRIAARPVNGHFLASQSIPVGGEPHFGLSAPARGAAFLAATGFESGTPHPVTVRLIAADGSPGAPTVAAAPGQPIDRIAFDVRPDGGALLLYGVDVGQPFADLYAERGQIDTQAPEGHVAELVTPSSGSLSYRVAGLSRFSVLGGRGLVPDRSEIEATNRKLNLVVRRGTKRESLDISGARFTARQSAGKLPSTDLSISPFSCPKVKAKAGVASASAAGGPLAQVARRRKARRSLFGHDHGGHFRTIGHWGAATVRGTAWRTDDACDFTRVTVTQGSVSFRDFRRKRSVLVRAGHSYTATSG
jgi:hypothetical protein